MKALSTNLVDPDPVVRKARCGWQAFTGPDHAYRIGVAAGTESEAREAFTEAVSRWADLQQRVYAKAADDA